MEKDHPNQAIDTELPDAYYVDDIAWESLREDALLTEKEENQ
jgi:hypothetical protein